VFKLIWQKAASPSSHPVHILGTFSGDGSGTIKNVHLRKAPLPVGIWILI